MKVYFEEINDPSLITDQWIPYIRVTDENIGFWMQQQIAECVIEVSDEKNLFRNFLMMASASPCISIKLFEGFDQEAIKEQLGIIVEYLKKHDTIVKEINGWKIQNKFDSFGESAIYVDPDGMVYYHPDCYYAHEKPLCHISEYKEDFSFTKPHLICLNCDTFYCNRNIYLNKKNTSEYKTPCSWQCNTTSLFSEYSKSMFNDISSDDIFQYHHLDLVDEFDADESYRKFLLGNIYNYIKGLDYSNRKLHKEES